MSMDSAIQSVIQSIATAIKLRQPRSRAGLGSSVNLPFPTLGIYNTTSYTAGALTTASMVANTITLTPYIPNDTVTLTSIFFYVTGPVAASMAKLVVYDSVDNTGAPNNLLYTSVDLSTAATGNPGASGLSIPLQPGKLYWIGVHTSAASSVRGTAVASSLSLGASSLSTTAHLTMIRRTQAYATPPPSTWGSPLLAEYIAGIPPVYFLKFTVN